MVSDFWTPPVFIFQKSAAQWIFIWEKNIVSPSDLYRELKYLSVHLTAMFIYLLTVIQM